MLDAVMLVLREVLEAALFISLLLALGGKLGVSWRWALVAVPLGLVASWWCAWAAAGVANAFDGTGQEILNTALYLAATASFIALTTALAPAIFARGVAASPPPRFFAALFVVIVAGSMAREGSEVWIYLSSFVGSPSALSAAITGGFIGAGIGLSVCALVFYAFQFVAPRAFFIVFFVLATLVSAGLAMQVAKLALQVGWLDGGPPVWDSAWLVGEQSWLGQLLHALFGYDANPDRAQAAFLGASLVASGLGAAIATMYARRNHGT